MSSDAKSMTLPAQHTTFNTLVIGAIKLPPNQKGKGPERKDERVMARNIGLHKNSQFGETLLVKPESVLPLIMQC